MDCWKKLKETLSTEPFWHSLQGDRNPAVLGERVFTTHAFERLFEMIDRLGGKGADYPLSTAVRFLMMMTLCHHTVLTWFADQLLTDAPIRALVLGDPKRLRSERAKAGTPPEQTHISKYVHQYMPLLLAKLEAFYYEMVRLYLAKYPELRFGLCFDASKTDTNGHPERSTYSTDPETGERKKVGTKPATDKDAATWVMNIHNPSGLNGKAARESDERPTRVKRGFGFHLGHIRPAKKGPPLVFDFSPPKKGNGERAVVVRLVEKMLTIFPELRLNGELAVFIADAGLESKRLTAFLMDLGYTLVVPVKRTLAAKLLKHERFITRGEVLRVRRDGVPACKQGPLKVLASDLGIQKASRFRCPMTSLGECPTPCKLEPVHDAFGRLKHPIVKRSIRRLTPEERFRFPLFPRRGKQFWWLFKLRSANERDYSYFKGRGQFEGLLITGEDNHALRFMCTLIVLTALALLKDGIELPAEIVDAAWPTAAALQVGITLDGPDVEFDEDEEEDELENREEDELESARADSSSDDEPEGDTGKAR